MTKSALNQGEHPRDWAFAGLTRAVAKLIQNTDRPNRNRNDADSYSYAERRVRTGDDPDDASADDTERNEIGEDRVAHALPSFNPERFAVDQDASVDMG
jgi:hypothetical protein